MNFARLRSLLYSAAILFGVETLHAQSFQAWDVSGLLSLESSKDIPTETLDGPSFLSLKVFKGISNGQFAQYEMSDEVVYKKLRLVSFRLDPCPTHTTSPTCMPEVRLVFQASGLDAAVHVFYKVESADTLKALAIELRQLRIELDGKDEKAPLDWGIHPASVAAPDEFAYNLKNIFKRFIGTLNLFRIANFQFIDQKPGPNGKQDWSFSQGLVVQEQVKLIPIFEGSNIPSDLFQTNAFMVATLDGFKPRTTPIIFGSPSSCNVHTTTLESKTDELLGNDFFQDFPKYCAMPKDKAKERFDAAVEVLDPRVSRTANVNCVSCHFAQTQAHQLAVKYQLQSNTISNELIGKFAIFASTRMFGYQGRFPQVSPRVRLETNGVLEQLRNK